MAFRILSEEEISLLTAEQLGQYEKALDVYKQRAAFVEKLTELENAEIKPYTPELKPINVIRELEFSSFTKPEMQKADLSYVQKPELPQNFIGKTYEKIDIAGVVGANFVIKEKAKVDSAVLSMAENFKSFEREKITMPELSKAVMPAATFTKVDKVLSKTIQLPKTAELSLHYFAAPTKAKIELPKTEMPKAVYRHIGH